MAKYELRLKARKLRIEGKSIRNITQELGVSKSSVSWWVKDVILTSEQIQELKKSEQRGHELGRLRSSLLNREKRLQRLEDAKQQGMLMLSSLNKKEFLIAGLALYWAEGGKSLGNRRVEFCNSDPKMVKFLIYWLRECLRVRKKDLRAVVGINQIHEQREQKVKAYWSEVSGIPLIQFRKTSFKKVNNKKIYDNFEVHYGTLSVLVVRPTKLYYKIIGLIEGLALAKIMAG